MEIKDVLIIIKKNEFVRGNCYTQTGADTSYYLYEVQPQFKGGADSLNYYIVKNLIYPKVAKEKGIEGKVYIGFEINKTGNVINVKVIKGKNPLLDEAAISVIEKMPSWVPGSTDGELRNFSFTLPVVFSLSGR